MKALFIALTALVATGCAVSQTDPADIPEIPEIPKDPGGYSPNEPCASDIDVVSTMRTKVSCEAYCRPDTEPRSSIMRITWLDDPRGNPGDSRIDLSVYKTGFEERAYASFCKSPAQQQAAPAAAGATIHMGAIANERSMQVRQIERQQARRIGEPNVLVIRDLEPGINYFWRAAQQTANGWLTSDVAYCAAAVCPVDYVDEQAPKKRPKKHKDDDYPRSQD